MGRNGFKKCGQALCDQGDVREVQGGTSKGPCQDLFIYLLKGVVERKDELHLGSTFVGNWVEDNSSFLFFSRPSEERIARLKKLRPELEVIEDYHFSFLLLLLCVIHYF